MSLGLFRKHPHMDAYYVGGSYQPYAVVGRYKRFTDGELAAEWQYQDNRVNQVCEGYRVAHDGTSMGSEEDEIEKLEIIHQFATADHYDE
jgi:hypothetical protein